MKLKVVEIPSIRHPLRASPGFAKKGLSDYALDMMGLCGYGCRYCSSNLGNYLRINQAPFLEKTIEQIGESRLPSEDPDLTFRWPDAVERLAATLETRKKTWGEGRTVVYSMLTDGFSPDLVADGTTRKALDMVLEKTSFRIRVLTKNACVGSQEWVRYFAQYADRFVVGLSIGTSNDAWSKRVEISTSPPSARLKALRRLQQAGVPTYGMLCPIFPEMMEGQSGTLPALIEQICPENCETIWAEPYNDRANWRHVRDGYDVDSDGYNRITHIFEGDVKAVWSKYATDLLLELRDLAERDGWIGKLVYLLYEDQITEFDVRRMKDLRGVSLQSKPDDAGYSPNKWIRPLQYTPWR